MPDILMQNVNDESLNNILYVRKNAQKVVKIVIYKL